MDETLKDGALLCDEATAHPADEEAAPPSSPENERGTIAVPLPATTPPPPPPPPGPICAITGLPAKYKDPVSGLPYATLEAFQELRKLHPAPERRLDSPAAPLPEGHAAGAAEGVSSRGEARTEAPLQRPIVLSSGMPRRINRVF